MRFLAKIRTLKFKSLIISAIIIAMYMSIMSILMEMWFVKKNSVVVNKPLNLQYVVVHLDLKGTPLKLSYLETLLPQLKVNGANSLLMEYEDMFPYEGRLVNLSAENCYRKSELKRFLTTAKSFGFEVIPLVQTFGHMEHALKLAEFQHLREVPQHPDSICPSKLAGLDLAKEMIEQVVKLHTTISPLRFIHIGCDEVFHLNKCQECMKRNMSNLDIFLHRVKSLSDIVKSLNVNTTVLIWDDMLRGIKLNKWNEIENFDNVQPVYWDYNPTIKVTHVNLLKLHRKFSHIWVASAFKGADGRIATFPITYNRFLNLFDWLHYIRDYRFGGEKDVYNFKGVILTGWSRYSHMDPPCELLPVSYPTLIINLLLVQKFRTGELSDNMTDKLLNHFEVFLQRHFSNTTIECVIENDIFDESMCKFDGQELFIALTKYSELIISLSTELEEIDELGLTCFEYYSKVGILNTNKISSHISSLYFYLETLTKLENWVTREMLKYYEEDFVTEYIHHKTQHFKKELQSTLRALDNYSKVRTWSRRTRNSSYFV